MDVRYDFRLADRLSVLGRCTQLFDQDLQLRMTDIYTQETYTSAINIHTYIYIYICV